jgi:hypothetical protein
MIIMNNLTISKEIFKMGSIILIKSNVGIVKISVDNKQNDYSLKQNGQLQLLNYQLCVRALTTRYYYQTITTTATTITAIPTREQRCRPAEVVPVGEPRLAGGGLQLLRRPRGVGAARHCGRGGAAGALVAR